jgi:hypothetical protein
MTPVVSRSTWRENRPPWRSLQASRKPTSVPWSPRARRQKRCSTPRLTRVSSTQRAPGSLCFLCFLLSHLPPSRISLLLNLDGAAGPPRLPRLRSTLSSLSLSYSYASSPVSNTARLTSVFPLIEHDTRQKKSFTSISYRSVRYFGLSALSEPAGGRSHSLVG